MIVVAPDGEKLNLMPLNIGPSHGATHGCLRYMTALDGENIVASVSEIGYLHRGFEKMVERGTWQQVVPYTDRLNYCSAMMNNFAYCRAVEELIGVEIPERAKVLRVIVNELSRIADHFICVAAASQDLGSTTGFFYMFDSREMTMVIWEKLTGARLTNAYGRIGGLYRDTYEGFEDDVLAVLSRWTKTCTTCTRALTATAFSLTVPWAWGRSPRRTLRRGAGPVRASVPRALRATSARTNRISAMRPTTGTW